MKTAREELERLVLLYQVELGGYLERRAGDLLRFEAAEDLLQGLVVSLLAAADGFQLRSDKENRAWFFGAAKKYLAMRRRYWGALKRDSGRLLRTGLGGLTRTGDGLLGVEGFAASQTGPSTFAWRREQLVVAARALALLMPRDRELVEWASQDLSTEEIAGRLGVAQEAAAKARLRAIERLRKAHMLVLKQG